MTAAPTRLLLHIGAEKTGSTAIQQFLRINSAALSLQGCHVPPVFRSENAFEIAATLWRPDQSTRLLDWAGVVPGQLADFTADMLARLADDARSGGTRIISTEFLLLHGRSPDEVSQLSQSLDTAYADTRVVTFLRRPEDLLASLYSTMIVSGRTTPLTPEERSGVALGRRFATIDYWRAAYQQRLLVRSFPRAEAGSREVILRLFSGSGIDLEGMDYPSLTNRRLSPRALEALRRINCHPGRVSLPRNEVLRRLKEATALEAGIDITPGERVAIASRWNDLMESVAVLMPPEDAEEFLVARTAPDGDWREPGEDAVADLLAECGLPYLPS